MMADNRFLIGQGERLSEEIARPPRVPGDKAHPYTFEAARERLAKQGRVAARQLRSLPDLACPDDRAVLEVTLHPSYLAKSYYPNDLFRELSLQHLGSRATHIRPEKIITKAGQTSEKAMPAPVFYVAADRSRLEAFTGSLASWRPISEYVRDDFRQIETLGCPGDDRLKLSAGKSTSDDVPLEVVLHVPEDDDNDLVVTGFDFFAKSLRLKPLLERRRYVGGLCFLPMRAPREAMNDLLQFTFIRALRQAARINPFEPAMRTGGMGFRVPIRSEEALAPDLSVAIFDGGLPTNHGLHAWVQHYDAPGTGAPVPAAQEHGLRVTSSFLFGPLQDGIAHETPFSHVDH